ncbi:protein of unknown function [Candidatus Methylomirabilis oxygeniifera]|uniref:Uncharacterized protein n=1 Tax=Methylomirabilis oxygeniifera TaxID=671143 RepID=D5MEJ7_METO1|nr:protein of unknown function [Candidatus Methylomirabilis oxyfera]
MSSHGHKGGLGYAILRSMCVTCCHRGVDINFSIGGMITCRTGLEKSLLEPRWFSDAWQRLPASLQRKASDRAQPQPRMSFPQCLGSRRSRC